MFFGGGLVVTQYCTYLHGQPHHGSTYPQAVDVDADVCAWAYTAGGVDAVAGVGANSALAEEAFW